MKNQNEFQSTELNKLAIEYVESEKPHNAIMDTCKKFTEAILSHKNVQHIHPP